MKRSTARRTERQAARESKRAALTEPATTDTEERPWIANAGTACAVRWEDAPEADTAHGPRVIGQMAWRDE